MKRITRFSAFLSAMAMIVLIAGSAVLIRSLTLSRKGEDPRVSRATVLNPLDGMQNGVSALLRASSENGELFAANYFPTLSGAVGDGIEDATAALQETLNAAGTTGGTVYLPQGTYLISAPLTVPSGVTLRGDFSSPESRQNSDAKTLLTVSANLPREGEALITLGDGAALIGITVFYEGQTPADPVAYPAAVFCPGNGEIRDVTLLNPYCGVRVEGTGSVTVERLWMSPLDRGVVVAENRTQVILEDVSVSPVYWLNEHPESFTGSVYEEMNAFLHANLQAVALEDVKDVTLARVRAEGAAVGLTVNVPRTGNGILRASELSVTSARTPLLVESLPSSGILISDSLFRPDSAAGADCIRIASAANAPIIFSACFFSGLPKTVFRAESAAFVSFYHCSFGTWWNTCFDVTAGTLVAVSPTFRSTEQKATLGKDGFVLLYDSPETARSEQLLFSVPDKDAVRTGSVQGVSLRDTARIGTSGIINALDRGVSTEADDNTPALQAALDEAGQNRGVVFLPEGTYRFRSTVAVPAGVRLIGVGNGAVYRTVLLFDPQKAADRSLIELNAEAGAEGLLIRLEQNAPVTEHTYAVSALADGARVRYVAVDAPRGLRFVNVTNATAEHVQLSVSRMGLLLNRAENTQVRDLTVTDVSGERSLTGVSVNEASVSLYRVRISSAAFGVVSSGTTRQDATVAGNLLFFRDTGTWLYHTAAGEAELTCVAVTGHGKEDYAGLQMDGVGSVTIQGAIIRSDETANPAAAMTDGVTRLYAVQFGGAASRTLQAQGTAVCSAVGCVWSEQTFLHAFAGEESILTMEGNLAISEQEFSGIDGVYLNTESADEAMLTVSANLRLYSYVDPESVLVNGDRPEEK